MKFGLYSLRLDAVGVRNGRFNRNRNGNNRIFTSRFTKQKGITNH